MSNNTFNLPQYEKEDSECTYSRIDVNINSPENESQPLNSFRFSENEFISILELFMSQDEEFYQYSKMMTN